MFRSAEATTYFLLGNRNSADVAQAVLPKPNKEEGRKPIFTEPEYTKL